MLNNINTKGMSIAAPHQSHNIPQELSLLFKHSPRTENSSISVCKKKKNYNVGH